MVGLGSFLVLNPSKESGEIAHIDDLGRLCRKNVPIHSRRGMEAFFEGPVRHSREGRYIELIGADPRI